MPGVRPVSVAEIDVAAEPLSGEGLAATSRGVGGKVLLVEYWNSVVSVEPSGLTVPASVAPVLDNELAAPVVTTGAVSVVNDAVGPGDGAAGLVATAVVVGRAGGQAGERAGDATSRSNRSAATGWRRPPGEIVRRLRCCRSATKTSPAASTATPVGAANPEPMVLMVPLGRTSLTALLSVSATKTSPAASTATPSGSVEPRADGVDGAVGQHLLDGVVALVGDEDVAGRVHRHAIRAVEPRADGNDGAVGQNLLDGVVAVVGDEDVAGRVHRHADRVVEPRADGVDGAVGQNLFDGVVAGVGDEDVAGRVHRHAVGS